MSDLTKSDIEEIIDKGLNNNKGLISIKDEIISITDYLSEYDNVVIETKYCECLIDRWLAESHECIKAQTDPQQVLETIKAIKSVVNVTDCCKLIGISPYNTLVNDLNNSSQLLKHLEKKCINRFKEVCLEAVFIQTSAISTEIAFVEECIELFKASKDPKEVCCDIQISDFLNGVDVCTNFRKFLLNLKNCRAEEKKYSKLKQLGCDLLKEDNFYLAQGLKDAVRSYLEPVIISETFVDGRMVLQVSGKYIILSRIVQEIEQEPRFSKIEEVRFVSSDVIHVDVDLLATKWHGRNVVVHSNSMIVSKNNCVWNVSGNDGKDTKELSDENEIYEPGKSILTQGTSGESGGNVMIIVNHLTGGEKLQIISIGGNGGKGLDGKKGVDGIDGESINDRTFQNLYPPVSLFKNSGKNTNLKKTHDNIRGCVKSVDCMFLNGSNLNTEQSNKAFNNTTIFEDSSKIYSLYFEITTNSGSKLQFSMYNETLTFCQSFLLYKGSAGTEGTPGLSGGRGGKGGFGGEIDVFVRNDCSSKILKSSFQGQPGPSGKDGSSGMPGKYGLDKAYMDHTLTLFGEQWPKYFFPLERDNLTLSILYTVEKSSKKVYAPHLDKYAEIIPKRREIRRSCSVQRDNLNKVENTFKEKSSRKKTISRESIMEKYGEIEGIVNISELSEYVGNAIAVLNDSGPDEAFDIERNSEDVTVTQKISFESDSFALSDWLKSLADISHMTLETNYTIKDPTLLLKQVEHNPSNLITLTNLAFVSMNLEQLNILWNVLDQANYKQSTELKIKNLHKIFFSEKYKLAVLEHLELQVLGDCLTSGNSSDVILNNNALPTSGIFQKIQKCGRVASYFVSDSPEKREEVVQICQNFADDECVKASIKIFLQEFGNAIAMHAKSKKLVKKHSCFEQRKVGQLKQILDLLKGELLKPKNRNLYQALIKSIIEDDGQKLAHILFEIKSTKFNLENGLLNRLFIGYLRALENKNAWIGLEDDQGNVDPDIRLEFCECIKHIGLKSRCYRNLLAFYYDLNIVIYTINEDSELVLTDNLNTKSRHKLILLNEDNIYSEVEINDEMAQMIKSQVSRGKKYSKTVLQIDSIAEKKDFDDFLNNMQNKTETQNDIEKSSTIATRVLNISTQDDDVKLIRNVFTAPTGNTMLSTRLEKLKLEYSGSENILHFMALHFKSEVNTVSAKELCFVINIILKFTLEDNLMPIVAWIIAAFPHSSWLSELTLLKIETKLKKTLEPDQKLRWREYISKQSDSEMLMLFYERLNEDNEDSNVDVELLEEVLSLISTIPKASVGLENVCLSEWKYFLKDRYWLFKVNSATSNWTEDQIKLISYYFLSLENKKGIPFCIKLLSLMDEHKLNVTESDKTSIEQTLRFLAGDETFIDDKIVEILSKCPINRWPYVLESSTYNADQYRSTEELINLIKSCGNTTEHVLKGLDNVVDVLGDVNRILSVLKNEIQDEERLSQFVKKLLACLKREESFEDDTETEIGRSNNKTYLSVIALFKNGYEGKMFMMNVDDSSKRCNSTSTQDYLYHSLLVSLVFFSIQILLKKELRETQKLAILTFLQSGEKILGQIATGEGKSLIVVSIAIIKSVLKGHTVDIVTSSNVLAQRDAEDYKAVYSIFNLGVGNNCSQNAEDRKRAYSNCKVVYGELASFQRDYLLDRFYSKNILGDRQFELIIVDEVDSMLLDQSNNILYLSHEIPGVDKLEPVFIFIWKWLIMPHEEEEDTITVSDLKEAIEYDLFGVIKMGNIRDLDLNLTENQVVSTWEYLINEGVIDSKGRLLMEEIDKNQVTVKDRLNCIPENHLRYLLKNVVERKRQLEIPNHLKTFVKAHLDDWINSALKALKLEVDVHYVVDVVRTHSNTSRVANIIILDSNTGTDMVNSHWDEGLHQFLQLKHGCRLSLISLKAVFKSNVSYFKLYTLLYGLTGTLGSIHDRDMLKEMYSVEFVTIPTAKPTKLLHNVPQVYQCPESWISSIIKSAYDVSERRSVLVVCETIKDVSLLEEKFKTFLKSKHNQRTILSYKRDYELITASDKKPLTAEPGQIILSTNLAGRGTDIKLSNALKSAGGLHVCLTFLPINSRIEEQAYGRVARNGEPGSSQLIVKSLVNVSSISKITDLKKERDFKEHLRITNIKKQYDSCVKVEEAYFDKFVKCYENLKTIKSPNEDMKNILLKDCLDQWAFWLDSKSRNSACESIDSFIDKLSNYIHTDFAEWFQHLKNPSHLLQLGLKCLKMRQYEVAISIFNQVIQNEPSFSESALYYRPFAKAKFKDIDKQDVICDFEKSRELFKKRVDTTLLAAQIIDWLKVHNTKSSLQIDSFKEQQENLIHMYMVFIYSIDQVLGSGVDYHQEINDVVSDLIKSDVIVELKIKKGLSENELKFLEEYGVAPKEMIEFLNKCGSQLKASDFKHRFALPSKELFWKELVEKHILLNEEKYVFIDKNKLKLHQGIELYQLLVKIILTLELEVEPTTKNHVWIYDHDYISGIESFSVCRKSSLLAKIGIENYKQLKSQGLFISNKRATLISTVKCIHFKNFNFLSLEDFLKVGISDAVAADILVELQNKKVIVKNNNQTTGNTQFCIVMSNIDQINTLELTKCKAYSEDVRLLLRFHFSFGLAMKELINLLSSNQPLKIKLNVKPHSAIIHALIERDILKSTVNCVTNHEAVLEGLYKKEMTLDGWRKLFTDIFDEEKTRLIADQLVKNKWLLELTRMNPNNWIEQKFKLNIKGDGKINTTVQMASELQNESDTIEFVLLRHATKTNRKHEYGNFLDAANGFINKVETPDFDLKPLHNILTSNKEPISELSLFSLNGIDQILQLGEKTWTWKMKRDTFIATLFGLTQVAIGSAFLCMSIVKTGIDDLIYCVNCMFTGTFHWKNYFINKVFSLVQILKAPLLKVFSSSFGNNISFSLNSIKNAGCQVIDACKHVTEKLINSCNGELFVSVLSRVVKAVGATAMSNTLYSIILPKIEYLGNLILNMFDKSIEEILKSHEVIGSAKGLYLTLGEKEAKDVIVKICSRVGDEYRSSRNNVWYKVLNNIKQIINTFHGVLSTLSNLEDAIEKAISDLYRLYTMITALFKSEEYTMIINPINHFLDTLDKHMKKEINTAKKFGNNEEMRALESCSLVNFSSDTIFQIMKSIKNEMCSLLNESIIHPLFHMMNDKLTLVLMDLTSKTFNKMFTNKEKSLVSTSKGTKVNSSNKIEPGKKSPKKQSYVDQEYDKCLVQLLKARKNNAVLVKILEENSEIDVSCLTFLCSVIPAVLKKNGINVPNLEITVNRSGVKEVYKTMRDKPASLSVTISTNEGILQNIENNKVIVKGLLKTIVFSLLPTDPQAQTIADSFLEEIIMLLLGRPSSNMDFEVKVNTETEKTLPPEYNSYQHSHPSGRWVINPNVDCYILKELKPESTLVEPLSDYIAGQIDRGFTIALSKLNSHIHRVQRHLKLPFNLALDDFDEVKFDIFPPTSRDLNMFHGRAIQYKLIMPFKVKGPKMVNFMLTLTLVNQIGKIEPFTPYGPHIVYQVEPINESKYMALGVKGHVLIDKMCATGITRLTDCHVAGNLILPTGFKFVTNRDTRKAIDVLVLGDLQLKYVEHYMNKASWEITVFQNLDNARCTMSVISNLFQCFKSPKCIIFHLGTSLLNTHRTHKDIAESVSNIVKLLMDNFSGTKIAMFSLHQRKFAEEAHNPTILKINGHLKRYCESIQVIYVETSRFLGADDLDVNGLDLNKRGQKKLLKCFEQVAQKCVT